MFKFTAKEAKETMNKVNETARKERINDAMRYVTASIYLAAQQGKNSIDDVVDANIVNDIVEELTRNGYLVINNGEWGGTPGEITIVW